MSYGAFGPRRGIITGANAAAGNVGERLPDQRLVGAALPLTSGIALTIVGPLVVPPGDYDAFGAVEFHGATSGTTVFAQGISTVTNSLPGFDMIGVSLILNAALNYTSYSLYPVYKPINTAVTLNLFMIAAAIFGGPGGVTANGWLSLRRSANQG